MYLTAQRVRRVPDGPEGINAFFYMHGDYVWNADTLAWFRRDPGQLVNQVLQINPPQGNRVRSFLDLICPDGTDWLDIRQSFIEFVGMYQRTPMPWDGTVRYCTFRIGMDLGIARTWQTEIATLYRAIQTVRR